MSALPSSDLKVLVTGASGFIALHCCKALLEAGFLVRGTVRNVAKGEYLKKLFEGMGFTGRFEYAIVGDISKDGAFDEAVKGVDAVEHVASPTTFKFNDPDEIIKPAINGTVGMLESVKTNGPSVKRVLIVSSTLAVESPHAAPYVFTENDWNDAAVQHFKSLGKSAPGWAVYSSSKVLAERAAWDYVEKHKDSLAFELTAVCPPWVWGPILQDVSSYDQINESTLYLLNGWKDLHSNEQLAQRALSFVDVRDFARLSADLLVSDKARYERVIISGGEFSFQDVIDNLSALLTDIPLGNPGATKGKDWDIRVSSGKVEGIIGKPSKELFRPLEETIKDVVKSCSDRGLISGVRADVVQLSHGA